MVGISCGLQECEKKSTLRKNFEGKTKTKLVAERDEGKEKEKKGGEVIFFGAKKRACTDHGKIASVSSGAGLLLSREPPI
jgi:hypothetical protein